MEKTSVQYSVLMAVYEKDNPEWVEIAIQSMLDQTLMASQFVVVKDGPIPAELDAVLEKYRNKYEKLFDAVQLEKNSGLGEALRVGVLHCKYDWIVRMDADDYSVPDRCEKQFAAQEKYQADMVGTDIDEFVGEPNHVIAKRVFPEKHDDILSFGRRRTPFSHPGILMRKSKVLEAGNYRTAFLHEDYDLFVRMLMKGCIGYNVKEPLVCMRVSEDFYARRGGAKYLKVLLKFNMQLYHIGWMKFNDFVVRSAANTVSCLMPNNIRDLIYKKLLRK